ncbi:DUF2931 family protein [Coprobacter tertius]|uniref:DUF2931 family protein n=1 Tax=Coprobacter tertius TaxID=2944915 RepID=A0ABT1MD65_9BACT|nr:DUF2931 family protein [Coprobacter tertius]MCP9610560.1 DUF2931 family protein [Coprobacter tertius]
MKIIMIYALLSLLGLNFQSCGGKNKKEMRTIFSWSPSVSTPYNYPAELHHCNVGFGVKGKSIPVLDQFPRLGIGRSGAGGVDLNAFDIEQGLPVPNSLDILWVSYTEKKFYKANIRFPEELQTRMLELFREGYYGVSEQQRFRYNNLVITLLPGGKIWLYLDGPHRYVRLDYTLQAEEVSVKLSDFVETRHKTIEDFCKGRLSDYPKAVENLSKNGIPKGLWDIYAERFPYDIKIEFENDQAELDPDYGYYCSNGEMFGSLDDVKSYPMSRLRYLIMAWSVADTVYTGHFFFNEDEVIHNYPEVFGNNSNPNIRGEFLIKVSKYNNRFDIFLRVGDRELKFEKTQIHVFRKWPGRTDKDDPVFYNNHQQIHSRDFKFVGE